jgi:hypothetical protein
MKLPPPPPLSPDQQLQKAWLEQFARLVRAVEHAGEAISPDTDTPSESLAGAVQEVAGGLVRVAEAIEQVTLEMGHHRPQ